MNLAIWDIESSSASTDFGSIIEIGGILVDENFKNIIRKNLVIKDILFGKDSSISFRVSTKQTRWHPKLNMGKPLNKEFLHSIHQLRRLLPQHCFEQWPCT